MRPVYLTCLVVFAVGLCSVALAQGAAPVPADGGWGAWKPLADVVLNSAIAGVVSLVGLVSSFFIPKLPSWLQTIFAKKAADKEATETREAVDWENYVRPALTRAITYGATKIGVTPDKLTSWEQKEGIVAFALGALRQFNGDIVEWFDKDGNGVIDILEGGPKRDGTARLLDVALMEAGAPAHVFEPPRNGPVAAARSAQPRREKPSRAAEDAEAAEAASLLSRLKPKRV